MDPQAVWQLGPSAAVIMVVGIFLRHIADERRAERELIGNHLAETVRALQQISDQLRTLADRLESHRAE